MISKAEKGEPLPVYGEGLNVRDWLYVEDHCSGTLAVIEKGRVGEVYNLGSHNERNNLYIVKRILSEMGKSEELITHVADRHGHDQRYAIDPHKVNVELGRLISESGKSSICNYDTGSKELRKLYEILVNTDGVYGTRFCGSGFKGCCLAFIDPIKRDNILANVKKEYLSYFPELDGKYSSHICSVSDGVYLSKKIKEEL